MITHNDMNYALEDDIKFEAFVHRLERTKEANPEDLMEFIRTVNERWHDICLDARAEDPLIDFSDDVLYAVDKQQRLVEELDDDATFDKHHLLRILESLEMKFTTMQESALGW